MAITGQNIADKMWTVVQDTSGASGVRWPVAEVLGWINDAQREIVLYHPQASTTTLSRTVDVGTRQSLSGLLETNDPAGIRILDVVRNMTSADVPGRAIRGIPREVLDAQRPNWHSETGTSIIHWMYDPRDTKSFFVYPALNAATILAAARLEFVYSSAPADLAAIGSGISLDAIYSNTILNYTLFRAYSKDAEYAQNVELSKTYYQLFIGSLTAKSALDSATKPTVPPA
jgi:enoyl reductase-like protein